jgi:hypothetical protein
VIEETEESMVLAKAYLEVGVVAERFEDDCRHVAMATVDRVDILLSWNCRHIVHYDKIRLFNAVNLIKGYHPLEIRTPLVAVMQKGPGWPWNGFEKCGSRMLTRKSA